MAADPVSQMTIEKTVAILQKSGSKYATMEMVAEDIEAGAPVNVDGTINLREYGAWLSRRSRGE